jgi:hypothetical protein
MCQSFDELWGDVIRLSDRLGLPTQTTRDAFGAIACTISCRHFMPSSTGWSGLRAGAASE